MSLIDSYFHNWSESLNGRTNAIQLLLWLLAFFLLVLIFIAVAVGFRQFANSKVPQPVQLEKRESRLIHVDVTSVAMENYSQETYLCIDILIHNVSPEPINYNSWNEGQFGYGVALTDELGNRYVRTQFGEKRPGVAAIPTIIEPGLKLSDRLFFRNVENLHENSSLTLMLRQKSSRIRADIKIPSTDLIPILFRESQM